MNKANINKEITKLLTSKMLPYKELMTYYRCAMMEVETKFKVLNEELSLGKDRNPIETIKTRLKSPESIAEKIIRKNISPTIENIEKEISDIAGVRVICSYPSDIYKLAEAFLAQDDINLIEKKDYFENPKDNGYRSLHLIVETPIFLQSSKKLMKVEIQFRTLSMDWWASLEHKISYKKDVPDDVRQKIEESLLFCSKIAADLDLKMESIAKMID